MFLNGKTAAHILMGSGFNKDLVERNITREPLKPLHINDSKPRAVFTNAKTGFQRLASAQPVRHSVRCYIQRNYTTGKPPCKPYFSQIKQNHHAARANSRNSTGGKFL